MDAPNYEKLNIWQDAMELVRFIYQVTQRFPREEIHGLTSQIRRAAVSVPANIAEGHGRGTKKDFRQFLYISKGSLQELSTLVQIARSMDYLDEGRSQKIRLQILSLIKRIVSLSNKLVPLT